MTLLQKVSVWLSKPSAATRLRALETETRLARERAAINRSAARSDFPFAGFAGRKDGNGR